MLPSIASSLPIFEAARSPLKKAMSIKSEESPAGSGLAQAGKDAIARMTFAPAEKDGKAVAFCGMEQPFEVKFRD